MTEATLQEKIEKIRKIAKSLTPEEKKDPEIQASLKLFKPLLEPKENEQ